MAKIIPNASIDELEELNPEVDAMEAELNEAVETTNTKKKKAKGEGKGPRSLGEGKVGAADIAAQLGITSRELRIFLRKNFRDMTTDKGHTYTWDKDSAEVQAVIDAYKAYKATPRKRAEKVQKEEAPEAVAVPEAVDLDDIDVDDLD